MSATVKRSVEVDLFRGVVLLIIVLDHVSGSLLSRITLHTYAVCDATEVFVFLGGYASASAYLAVAARRDTHAANVRFVTRAWQIYRAFLVTAALMLILGMVLHGLGLDTPTVQDTAAVKFEQHPLHVLVQVFSLKRQPYLSAVLPMYAIYALLAPLIVYAVQRRVWATVLGSVLVWLVAPVIGHALPSVGSVGWSFNPFAWQLMFVGGVVCKMSPPSAAFQASRWGSALTRIAVGAICAFAAYRLFLQVAPEPGFMKQNLSVYRVTNFLAIAWVAGQMVRLQWVKQAAAFLPWVITVGRQGLPCFVSGAAISLVADTLLQAANRSAPAPSEWLRGLLTDVLSISAVLLVAQVAERLKQRRVPAVVPVKV